MSTDAQRDGALVEREAIAWFARLAGRPTAAEKRDFEAWLARAPDHLPAWEAVTGLLARLDASAGRSGRDSEDLAEPLQRIAAFRRGKALARTARRAVGCLAVVAFGAWLWLENPHFLQNLQADHVTARAERRSVTLEDGSRVLMDADTAFALAGSASERRVRLLRGTASFAVQPSAVPFVVEAEGGELRVLGTAFDVGLGPAGEVTVTLLEGKLQVSLRGGGEKLVLAPGESVDYDSEGLGPVRRVDLEEATAWHDGRLVFDNARLADVLAHIGRYREGRIVLLDTSLGERRISGNISLDNSADALRAMQSSMGFPMTEVAGRLTLIGP